ncbi:unnamed protein product [Ambrosiozyma monospora]|uniref:Unnamed protein product n=1 Tax=Ambrosiozyma monospora TaxID=43982 RepID=A0ACB5SU26_AMBMO|nr:unnamed protein product [Ambrosiozyma monospora]
MSASEAIPPPQLKLNSSKDSDYAPSSPSTEATAADIDLDKSTNGTNTINNSNTNANINVNGNANGSAKEMLNADGQTYSAPTSGDSQVTLKPANDESTTNINPNPSDQVQVQSQVQAPNQEPAPAPVAVPVPVHVQNDPIPKTIPEDKVLENPVPTPLQQQQQHQSQQQQHHQQPKQSSPVPTTIITPPSEQPQQQRPPSAPSAQSAPAQQKDQSNSKSSGGGKILSKLFKKSSHSRSFGNLRNAGRASRSNTHNNTNNSNNNNHNHNHSSNNSSASSMINGHLSSHGSSTTLGSNALHAPPMRYASSTQSYDSQMSGVTANSTRTSDFQSKKLKLKRFFKPGRSPEDSKLKRLNAKLEKFKLSSSSSQNDKKSARQNGTSGGAGGHRSGISTPKFASSLISGGNSRDSHEDDETALIAKLVSKYGEIPRDDTGLAGEGAGGSVLIATSPNRERI